MSSSFKNNRIVVASLFLPSTVVLGESNPSSPNGLNPQPLSMPPPSTVTFRLGDKTSGSPIPPMSRMMATPGPLRSIVDDLKDKSRIASPAIAQTPAGEQINPFSRLSTAATLAGVAQSIHDQSRAHTAATGKPTPPPSPPTEPVSPTRRHQTTYGEHGPSRPLRKSSRSTTRRAPSVARHTEPKQPWHVELNTHCNGGLKNAIESMSDKLEDTLWVGTLGTDTDRFEGGLRKEIDEKMIDDYNSVPVWIPDTEFASCYDEFCHQVLWPALHYAVPDAPKTKMFYESESYKQYVAVNQRFADAIIANYQEGDIVWINDYHLMLVPAMLRASPLFPETAPIGFFLHVTFPSSEIFRCLAVRRHLLKGILGADVVGFQTANNARHFRQTVSRILSWEAVPRGILVGDEVKAGEQLDQKKESQVTTARENRGRFVDIGVFPMGIDVTHLREKRKEPEVEEWTQVLKQRYAGMKIIVGRDKLDEIQGVRQKILAFEVFLEKYPDFQGKVVLIQVALQTTELNELGGGVLDVVSRINSRFSTLTYQPVVFLHTQDLTFSQYLALLTVADAFLVTSLREGMALRTHEFVECQEGSCRPLILSEFTGSYSYSGFRSCLPINPYDVRGTADAIHQALTMSNEEAISRWEDLHNHVTTQTAQAFVTSFLTRCIRSTIEKKTGEVPHLDVARILPRYKHSQKRLILVDFEDTLWARNAVAAGRGKDGVLSSEPPEDVMEVLSKLCAERKNEVWLLSGLPIKGLLQAIAERIPRLGIVAENGCFIKTRDLGRRGSMGASYFNSSNGNKPHWISLVSNFNLTWKSACSEILHYFTERTPGSFVEEREASMVWRFCSGRQHDDPDRQWALRQAAEAQNHIFDSLGERYRLRIIPGRTSFLVLPTNISRTIAVGAILHPGGPTQYSAPHASWMPLDVAEDVGGDLDFVLAVSGDDQMLRKLNEIDSAETCSTSGKGTDAKWSLEGGEALGVLASFANL